MALNVAPIGTLAVTPEPTTSFFAIGLPANNGQGDYLTPPDWEFAQPLNNPVDFASVMVSIRSASDHAQTWYMEFAGPAGSPLAVGTYSFADRADFRPAGLAGFELLGTRSACDVSHGAFTIYELERQADGIATKFAASFDVWCGPANSGSYVHGEINIASTRSWPAWRADKVRADFVDVLVGEEGRQQVTISSIGTEPVTLQGQTQGTFGSEYTFDDDQGCLGQPIAAGISCTFDVVFTPAVRGSRFAQLWLSSDGFKSIWSISLWGNALDPTLTTLSVGPTAAYPFGIDATSHVASGNGNGKVNFEANSEVLGNTSLYQRDAETVLYFPPGQFPVVAHYLGNSVSAPSVSDATTVQGRLATSTTFTTYPDGPSVRLFARVIPPGSYDLSGGTLSLVDVATGSVLATTSVAGQQGELRTNCVSSDPVRQLMAVYSGNGLFDGSTKTLSVGCTFESPDDTSPAGSVVINDGAQYTNTNLVTLTIAATDPSPGSGVASMQLSSTDGSWPNQWQPYMTSGGITLDGADGAKPVFVRFRDGAGNISQAFSDSIVLDRQFPVGNPPSESFVAGTSGGGLTSILMSFGGSTDATSGIAANQLQQSADGGATYAAIPLPPMTTSTVRMLTVGGLYRFRSRSVDGAGNVGPWSIGPSLTVSRVQESGTGTKYSGSWAKKSSSSASASAYRQASAAGASVTLSFTGRDVAFFARLGPNAGRADVYVDGVKIASGLDFYSPTNTWKRVMFAASFDGAGAHQMTIRVLGTKSAASTGTTVNIDGFLVMK